MLKFKFYQFCHHQDVNPDENLIPAEKPDQG